MVLQNHRLLPNILPIVPKSFERTDILWTCHKNKHRKVKYRDMAAPAFFTISQLEDFDRFSTSLTSNYCRKQLVTVGTSGLYNTFVCYSVPVSIPVIIIIKFYNTCKTLCRYFHSLTLRLQIIKQPTQE